MPSKKWITARYHFPTIEVMATFRYKYTGTQPVHFPALDLEIKPGQIIEAEHIIHHPDFEAIKEAKKEEPKAHK